MSRIAIKLAALGQDGLTFADGDYDLDRYRQVSELAAELLAAISGRWRPSSWSSCAWRPNWPA